MSGFNYNTPRWLVGRNKENKRECGEKLRGQMTPEERRLWTDLRANRLGGFHIRRQAPIEGFIVDFYCHEARLAIEVAGPVHSAQREYDAERDLILAQSGIYVVRVSNESIRHELGHVLRTILTLIVIRTSPRR